MGIPCFAHESDLSLGLANRLSAKKCECVFTSFLETADKIHNGKYSGAPIRQSLFYTSKKAARKEFGFENAAKVLLVFGGGSGSTTINEAIRKNIKKITEKYAVLHVCGKGNVIKSNVKNYHQVEFIKDMGSAYACADAVISRAGAGTVFELISLKKPALLIPLSGQTRGDQAENAAYFQRKGLCRVLKQSELSSLPQAIEKTIADGGLKERLKEADFTPGNEVILREIRKLLQ
jgi:UDP-N-acetylglucosamine--N-acetylmuramyl-(pentapeptide) pyrophosphoryl-undecaprenol N-acetylglucosamine transferase